MNVLFLMGDHHRADAMSWTGNPHLQTPNLDRVAEQSVRFHNCFNQSPVCSPARHCLNTGQYAHRHGVTGNGRLPYDGMRTLAHALKPKGYRCFHTGHMHWVGPQDNGYEPKDWTVPRQKWKERLSPRARKRWDDEHVSAMRRTCGGPGPRKPEEYSGYADKEATITFLEDVAKTGESFLAFCPFTEPHPPFFPPKEYYERVDQTKLPGAPKSPEGAALPHPFIEERQSEFEHLTDVEYRQITAAYYGLTMMMDDFAGEVLEALDRLNLRKDTIVIWTSDHGDQMGEHGLLTKFVTREASVRAPLMISVPGQVPLDVDALTEHVDLFPTVCELLEVDVPDAVQGRSLVPWLQRQSLDDWRSAVFSEIHELGAPHINMIRTMDWKLNTYDGHPGELYNLLEDPDELHNLCDDPECQDKKQALEQELRAWRRATRPSDDVEACCQLPV